MQYILSVLGDRELRNFSWNEPWFLKNLFIYTFNFFSSFSNVLTPILFSSKMFEIMLHFWKYTIIKYCEDLKEDIQSTIYLIKKLFSKKINLFIYSYNTNLIPTDQLFRNNRTFERFPISLDNRQFDILWRNRRA